MRLPDSLVSNSTIQRAIDQARFFVPEIQLAEKTPRLAQGLAAAKRREAAEREALRHRLVKAAKCPTDTKPAKQRWDDRNAMMEIIRPKLDLPESEKFSRVSSIETITPMPDHINLGGSKYNLGHFVTTGEALPVSGREKQTGAGKWAVVSKREWSGEFRIRTQVDQPHAAPPEQSGTRITTKLSDRGALAIADSCHFMAVKHNGFRTFLTLTFEQDSRDRIDAGEISIQKEASRLFDGLQKMAKRGWVAKHRDTNESKKIAGIESLIKYCWVAENPKNQDGSNNPHIHVLMDWAVPYHFFPAWAARIEGIWKHGYAKLEKMRDPEQAGAYMAKAAGYLSKGAGQSDQGEIHGNRYGISADARAPDWECVTRAEMGSMGYLIKDIHDYFGAKYGHVFKERTELNTALNEIKEQHKRTKEAGAKITKSQASERAKIGEKLAKVRKAANDLPAVAGKYQLLIKGVENFSAFWDWALTGERTLEQSWLPELHETETWDPHKKADSLWYGELKKRRKVKYTRTWFGKLQAFYSDCVEQVQRAFGSEYNEYEQMGIVIHD